jgi:hypothetical protein
MPEEFDLLAWLSEGPPPHRCPLCGGPDCERLPRTLLERVFFRKRRPYRCLACGHRFFDVPKSRRKRKGKWDPYRRAS